MILKEAIYKTTNKKTANNEARSMATCLRNPGNRVNINPVWGLGLGDKCIFQFHGEKDKTASRLCKDTKSQSAWTRGFKHSFFFFFKAAEPFSCILCKILQANQVTNKDACFNRVSGAWGPRVRYFLYPPYPLEAALRGHEHPAVPWDTKYSP